MIIKRIPQIGDPILRQRAKNLTLADLRDPKTKRVIKNLIDTMRDANLVGMAAPQIGQNIRIFVAEVRKTAIRDMEAQPLRVFINPRINWMSKQGVTDYEGCGSVVHGDLLGPVCRSKSIEVEYDDIDGKRHVLKTNDFLAIVIQHEMDHLDGILFTDRVKNNKMLIDVEAYKKIRDEEKKNTIKTTSNE